MCIAAAAGESAAAAVAEHGVESRRAEFAVAAAKSSASGAGLAAARIAHQVHGAIGLTEEYALGAFTMRLWSWSTEAGNEAFWSAWLGERVRGFGPDSLWSAIADTADGA